MDPRAELEVSGCLEPGESLVGLAADNLIAAEVVTAAGDIVRAGAQDDRELFWGLRGGGGNFGVVSWFEYRLHSVGPVTSGLVAHPMERARDVLRFFRDITSDVPDELTLDTGLLHAPDGSGVCLAAIVGCHCGALADGEASTRPIKRFGSPVVDTLGPASYVDTNTTIFDAGFPRGARNYWKSSFLAELDDVAIEALVAQFAVCPSPMSGLVLEHFHGAATRVGVSDTAFPQRREATTCSSWPSGSTPGTTRRTSRGARATYDALRPNMARESYANYQTEDDKPGTPEHPYGSNYERLVALKNRFDPTNVFHLNSNVMPTPERRLG